MRDNHPSPRLVLVVAAALFDGEGRVLIARRPPGKQLAGLWEFPGGKVEPGESPEAALARELAEELSIWAEPSTFQPLTFASHAYDDFHLLMPLYAVREWAGAVHAREHDALAWVPPTELGKYEMPPADGPLVAALERL